MVELNRNELMSFSEHRENVEQDLKRQLWVIEGMIKFNFAEQDLLKVISKHESTKTVPKHYYYTDLLRTDFMPNELRLALLRKPGTV